MDASMYRSASGSSSSSANSCRLYGTCGVAAGRSLRPIRSDIVTSSAFAILSPPCPRGSPSGPYSRRMSESRRIIGRWRITEMGNWDQEAVNLVEPGFIEFDEDGLGELGFIAVTGELDCRDADRDGTPGVEFSWQGSDEGDDVSGRGWAALNPMARSWVTSTSTLVMIPRSAPSGSTEWSGECPHRTRDGGKLSAQAATSPNTRPSPLSTSSNRSPRGSRRPTLNAPSGCTRRSSPPAIEGRRGR